MTQTANLGPGTCTVTHGEGVGGGCGFSCAQRFGSNYRFWLIKQITQNSAELDAVGPSFRPARSRWRTPCRC